jgi:tRNA(Ile)-lysidine synthase
MEKTEQVVIKFITDNNIISEEDKILVAFSGGPDSVFLLSFLNKFKRKFNINIGAFHLNHNLRGKEADLDEQFCREMCLSLQIPFFCASENIRQIAKTGRLSLEEAGRVTRYKKLEEAASREKYNKIATAHNSNDNTETVLLNLVKGTGLRGIAGIPVVRGNIIRPILILTKEEILDYLAKHKISCRFDASNLSDDYERNFLRNKIVPLIKEKLNPSLEKSILFSSVIFRNYYEKVEKNIENEIKPFLQQPGEIIKIPVKYLQKKKEPELSEFIKYLLERNFYIQVKFKDVSGIISLMNKEAGTKVNLSGNFTAFRDREDIIIYPRKAENPAIAPVKIKPGENIGLGSHTFSVELCLKVPEKFPNNRQVEYISADNLEEEFLLRPWVEGDRFRPLGLKGSKKVSDFLNDQKIDSISKKNQLVLTNRGRIVWIPGFRIDDRFKIKNSTKKVYKLCLT